MTLETDDDGGTLLGNISFTPAVFARAVNRSTRADVVLANYRVCRKPLGRQLAFTAHPQRKGPRMKDACVEGLFHVRRTDAKRRSLLMGVTTIIMTVGLAACGSSSATGTKSNNGTSVTNAPSASSSPSTTAATSSPSTTQCTIPQNNGGDHDADNNGAPSDGDGCDI
jgi:hypothetical protein